MNTADLLNNESVFSLKRDDKKALFDRELCLLTDFHRRNCRKYSNILDALEYENDGDFRSIPYVPVSLFKKISLRSTEEESEKTLSSSGTTSSERSMIYINQETAILQQQALAKIGSDFLGENRRNMLILDTPESMSKTSGLTARDAAVRGFSVFSRKRTFAMNESLDLDLEKTEAFFTENEGREIFIFGLTYILWDRFFMELKRKNVRYDLSKAVIIHGGGWKKLSDIAVSSDDFERALKNYFGSPKIVEYYGMAEQTGSIFFRCRCGNFHCSDFSDIIIRDEKSLEENPAGKEGLIEAVSLLPKSYPGHIILTEDRGMITGVDDCGCGRKGACFKVTGRLENTELRGCSNVL